MLSASSQWFRAFVSILDDVLAPASIANPLKRTLMRREMVGNGPIRKTTPEKWPLESGTAY